MNRNALIFFTIFFSGFTLANQKMHYGDVSYHYVTMNIDNVDSAVARGINFSLDLSEHLFAGFQVSMGDIRINRGSDINTSVGSLYFGVAQEIGKDLDVYASVSRSRLRTRGGYLSGVEYGSDYSVGIKKAFGSFVTTISVTDTVDAEESSLGLLARYYVSDKHYVAVSFEELNSEWGTGLSLGLTF